jgi:fused signal recognition particle receptor
MILLIAILATLVVVFVISGVGLVTTRRRRSRPAAPPPARPEAPPRPTRAPAPAPPAPAPEAEAPVAEPEAPAPAVEPEAPAPEVPGPPPRFRDRLGKARGLFSGVVGSVRGKGVDPAVWDELEEALLRADVGVATTDGLLEDLRGRVKAKEITGGDALLEALRADLVGLLAVPGTETAGARDLHYDDQAGVTNVWLFVGVNGVGKTTTVGKVARHQTAEGRRVLLAAGDTFRAAAGEQLEVWAERTGAEIVRGAEGGDPSAVVFDAVQRAAARGHDLVLADTAGRLHTKVNLVEELKKIRRVADRDPGRVTEVLLVLDATTGQNGLVQARQFTDAVDLTGVVLTKLDGTAKGGVVVAIQRDLGIPVKLVGLGEGPDDLVPFDPEEFVDALLAG